MDVIEITNPDLLSTFLISDLFRRAFPSGSLVTGGFEEAPERFALMVADPRYRFLVGVEETELASLACLFLPDEDENVHAQVVQFYNAGSSRLRGKVVDELAELAKGAGHDRLWAINQTGRPPSVWARMFSRAGPARKVGEVMEVSLVKELAEDHIEEQEFAEEGEIDANGPDRRLQEQVEG